MIPVYKNVLKCMAPGVIIIPVVVFVFVSLVSVIRFIRQKPLLKKYYSEREEFDQVIELLQRVTYIRDIIAANDYDTDLVNEINETFADFVRL